jgi:hypothetical protein
LKIDVKDLKINTNPIFIVGFPRSGTTLLQSMLCTQKKIYSFPETHFFSRILPMFMNKKGECILSKKNILKKLKGIDKKKDRMEVPDKIFEILKSYEIEYVFKVKEFFDLYVSAFLMNQVVDLENLSKYRFVEKTPAHLYHIDFILSLYPSAKFIYIIRYPHNVIYSNIKNFKGGNFNLYRRYAKKWRYCNEIIDKFKVKNPGSIILSKYEDIVKENYSEFIKICSFINVKADKSSLGNTRFFSKNIISNHEKWKKRNASENINSRIKNYKWPMRKHLFISLLLRKEMINFKYCENVFDSVSQLSFIQGLIDIIPANFKRKIK